MSRNTDSARCFFCGAENATSRTLLSGESYYVCMKPECEGAFNNTVEAEEDAVRASGLSEDQYFGRW